MPISEDKTALTNGWAQNCSFNCVTHFLCAELEKKHLKELKELYKIPGYNTFLRNFETFYPECKPATVEFLKEIVKQYPNPMDREVIFGPVLRRTLQSIMLSRHPNPSEMAAFYADARLYLKNPLTKLSEFENPYTIIGPTAKYLSENRAKIKTLSEEDQEKFLNNYFLGRGYKNYVNYICDPKNETPIDVWEFSNLTKELSINLFVYSHQNTERPYAFKTDTNNSFGRDLTVYNGGNHWEYEASNVQTARSHNKYYYNPEEPGSFLKPLPTPYDKEEIARAKDRENTIALVQQRVTDALGALFKKIQEKIASLTGSGQPKPALLSQYGNKQNQDRAAIDSSRISPEPKEPEFASIKRLSPRKKT